MNKEFEKLKEQFGTVNVEIKSSKQELRISHIETDIKEFAGNKPFSFDLETLLDSNTPLGPHGHTGSTYILEWNTKEYPHHLSLRNKKANKIKDLLSCPDYLQNYVITHIEEFAHAFQSFLKINKEELINSLYDSEEKRARLEKDDL